MNKVLAPEKYWDSVAQKKVFTTPFQMALFKEHVKGSAQILDVGCGYGRTLNELYQSGFRQLSGIDISGEMIHRATCEHSHLDLRKYENGSIPFGDDSFDAVILVAVLTCIINDRDLETLMNEVRRVLRDDGVLYINDFMINDDQRNIDRYTRFEAQYKTYGVFELEEGAALRHFTRARIEKLTRSFESIVFQPVVYTTMNGNQSNGFYFLGKK